MKLLLGMMVMLSALRPGISWLPMTPVSLLRRCAPLRTSQTHGGVPRVGGLGICIQARSRLQSSGGTMRIMGDAGEASARNFRILVADKVAPYVVDELRAMKHEVEYSPSTSSSELTSKITEFGPNILVVRSTIVKSDAIAASSNLEVIIRAGAGVDNIELSAAAEAGVLVANCPGANAAAVSELAWSLILACDRNIVSQTLELKEAKWDKGRHADTRSHTGIKGRTLGIVGFGSIGQEVARVGKAMGMQVVVWRRNHQEGAETVRVQVEGGEDMEVGVAASLEELAARSDVVSVHVASSSETRRLLGEAFFGSMRPGSIFINTARGSVVDEKALLEAIESKGLKVGLDVYENEPKAPKADFRSELAMHPLVVGTHHVGAGTLQAEEAVASKLLDVVSDLSLGKSVANLAGSRGG